jgi:photosystem II stability/assembly factor-like uncharacterized protein
MNNARKAVAGVLLFGMLAVLCSCASEPRGVQRPPKAATADDGAKRLPATGAWEGHQWRRLAWLDERGEIAPGVLQRALEQREANMAAWAGSTRIAGIAPDRWTSRGPNNIGGRTLALVIHPTETNKLWAGGVDGGIWHSTDGGLTWKTVDDTLPNLAIGALAIAPSNPSIMYAGTGEGFFNGDAVGGIGMYKSTDGGATWSYLGSTSGFGNVCSIAVHPTNANIVLVGTRYYGIQKTINGGSSWSNPYWAQGCYYVAFDPTNGSKAIAEIIDYNFTTGQWFHRAAYSTNTGASWSAAGGLGTVADWGSRIALTYHKGNPGIVYATCAADSKIYKSTDGGKNYAAVTTSGTSDTNWYCAPLWVDPTNPNIVLAGGYHTKRSTDGGVTLTQISNGYINTIDPHPDIHTIISDPGFNGTTNKRVYICTDGGVYKTEDVYAANQGVGWARLEQTYRTTQFYGAVGDGASGLIYGGTQDNGSLLLSTGSDTAAIPFGGDGGFCAIDWDYPNVIYGEYITLQIHRSKNGGASASYITGGLSDAGTAANFIAPFILDPNNSNTMLAGGASLWRSKNVRTALFNVTWSRIRNAGTSNISAIAVAPGNSDIVWAAQNDGRIDASVNGTAATPTWSVIDDNGVTTNPLPDRYCTRLVVDPLDHDTVYAAFGGFSPDNLWRTTDGGATWQDITGVGPTGLPDAPIRGVALHPSRRGWIYVGTEVGVFASADGGATWATNNEGPNAASVDELNFMHGSTVLLSATHGRGLWTSPTEMCSADFNGDGFVNGDDYDVFAQLFDAGSPAADFNSDGFVNGNDYDEFAVAFDAGC